MARRKRRDLFDEDARALARRTVEAVESQTSAEIVVSLRRVSGDYRAADFLGGSVLALFVLAVLIFHPEPLDERWFVVDVALAWLAGAWITSRVDALRRPLVGRRALRRSVELAARSAFLERGVSSTRGRTGSLVYLAGFERDAAVVLDVGLGQAALGPGFEAQIERLREAMRTPDPHLIMPAIEALAPHLAAAFPATEHDENELPDDLEAHA